MSTPFGPKEVVMIMSLCRIQCPAEISACRMQLCQGFDGNMAGYTVFHALAGASLDCFDIHQVAWQESEWPQAKDMLHLVVKRNNLGLLPSAVAAQQGNMNLCLQLTQLEAETAKRASNAALKAPEQRLEASAHKEFEFMFKMLTLGNSDHLVIPLTHMQAALIDTAQLGYRNTVRKLLEIGVPVSIRVRRNETALHIIAHAGDVSMIKLLLERGAEVDAKDQGGSTPLRWASWAGRFDTARDLLLKGAKVNAQDKSHRTALFGAAGGGYADVVRLLLARGADKSLRGGKDSQTPLEKGRQKEAECCS
ncbi:uncharacterized protein PODANS_5_4173 [Podospora anserina S mat+]|uniref:Ankyrin repeats-containing protein n=1 Tax=Podospora anserina (strain S / ATCC MYA-4624 / DSM 980 / FGSC 10383) TaxID=515849 RepID=B2ALN7_PODAN|nr:uncharacterized protein PODANS_5_4173 [Podospora anserina S mat+]CAP64875.1 unnamed protein product [Podospora anserina S mat+]CDP29388.1 Putative ankyrin repeats-containing protein [Podospora anserina S mat+]